MQQRNHRGAHCGERYPYVTSFDYDQPNLFFIQNVIIYTNTFLDNVPRSAPAAGVAVTVILTAAGIFHAISTSISVGWVPARNIPKCPGRPCRHQFNRVEIPFEPQCLSRDAPDMCTAPGFKAVCYSNDTLQCAHAVDGRPQLAPRVSSKNNDTYRYLFCSGKLHRPFLTAVRASRIPMPE